MQSLTFLLAALLCGALLAADEQPLLKEGPNSHSKSVEKFSRPEPLDEKTLSPNYAEDWKAKDFVDEKLGISIQVTNKDKAENPLGKADMVRDEKVKWLWEVSRTPERTITVYIKQTEATVKSAIENPAMNLFVRYIALKDIYMLNFTSEEQLDLIKFGAADHNAELRDMAMLKAGAYKNLGKVIPICSRTLADPSLTVADAALRPLVKFFDLRNPEDGKEYETGFEFTGLSTELDKMLGDRISLIARSIHAIRPDLLTDDDLKAIVNKKRQD